MAQRVISTTGSYTGYSAAPSIDAANDWMLIQQSGSYFKINRNTLLGLSSAPLGTTDTQSPTNKTFNNTNTFTIRDDRFTLQDNGDVTKQATFELSAITAGQTRVMTLPNSNATLVGTSIAQTLTNKTITGPIISGGTIDNSTVTVDAISEHTSTNGVTIDGLNIKDGALNSNNSVVASNITDGAVTPAKLVSGNGAGWAWSSWVPVFTNFSVGNGSYKALYKQTGKTVEMLFTVQLGSSSSVSGLIGLSPPVNFSANYTSAQDAFNNKGDILDVSVPAFYTATLRWGSASRMDFYVDIPGATYSSVTSTSSTVPMTWAQGDIFSFSATIEGV